MRSTKCIKRITVQSQTKVANDIGGWSNTWATAFTCWAKVTPMSRTKQLYYGMTNYKEFYEVEARTRETNISTSNRIVYGGNAYQMVSTPLVFTDHITFDIAR